VSKYCQSVEAFGMAPRSVFHIPDEVPTDNIDGPAWTGQEAASYR
jgi:hypothetical protein